VSPQNQYFVLHDSQGFEPGDLSNFETVSKFVQERSGPELPLCERIHGLWYVKVFCPQPMPLTQSSGSVQRLPQLAVVYLRRETRSYSSLHTSIKVRFRPCRPTPQPTDDHQSVPLVIVFTQYDRLVRTKEAELREDYPQMDRDQLRELSLKDAQEAFDICLKSLQGSSNRLRIPMPRYARVSGAFPPIC
jgi:hypothetical protein